MRAKWRTFHVLFSYLLIGHFSDVTIQLKQDDDGTSLTLTQTGIPDSDHERTKDGWKKYIFDAIKATFGYGANLF